MRKIIFVLAFVAIVIAGCAGGGEPTPEVVPPPGKVTLTFPEQNALCTQGAPLSATQSTLVFKWNTAANTDTYDFSLKNLLTGVTATSSVNANETSVTLNVNTPYSWSVTSKSAKSKEVTQSDSWKFYNSGPGVLSYAPYPAEIVSPTMKQNVDAVAGAVTLSWTGNDVDSDITGYDVYFGTTATPALYKSGVSTPTLTGVSVTAGTTYYWNVITKDSKGNTSDSGIYQFKVN